MVPAASAECGSGVNGIVEDGVCCHLGCGECGGEGCGEVDGLTEGDCCISHIAENADLCSVEKKAPCVLDPAGG